MRFAKVWVGVLLVAASVHIVPCGGTGVKGDAGKKMTSPLRDAVTAVVENIRARQGWKREDTKMVGVDFDEARVGKGCLYDVRVGVGDKEIDFNLASEVVNWEQLRALPRGGGSAEPDFSDADKALDLWQPALGDATLPEFDLAGPVELWIQDAENLRLSVPHDVDAGLLKRVVIAEGAVVTIKGAREVSLMRPLQLPLPLQKPADIPDPEADMQEEQQTLTAAGLMGLAARLRKASRESDQPVLSLKVVGPSSLVAANASPEDGAISRLRVRRLSPGAVELVTSKQAALEEAAGSATADDFLEESGWVWPLPEVEATDKRLLGFEQALQMVLGNHAYRKGSFRLLKGKASAVTIVHVPFEVEHRLPRKKAGVRAESATTAVTGVDDDEDRVERQAWEAVVKYEGGKVLPISAQQVLKAVPTVSISWGDLTQNGTLLAENWIAGPPPRLTSLEPDWNGLA